MKTLRNRKPGHAEAIQEQMEWILQLRHAGGFGLLVDADPLARVWRDLSGQQLRNLTIASSPVQYCRQTFIPRWPLLVCRFRAVLFKYRQHGFTLQRLKACNSRQLAQYVQNLFGSAVAYPFQEARLRRKAVSRQALRIVPSYFLPRREKTRSLTRANPARVHQLIGQPTPHRRESLQTSKQNRRHHAPPLPTNPTR